MARSKSGFPFWLLDIPVIAGIAILYLLHAYPEFKGMRNLKIDHVSKEKISVSAEVELYNPNRAACELQAMNIDCFANGKKVANVSQNFSARIAGQSHFQIPLNISFSPKEVFNLKDLLGSVISTLTTRKVDLEFRGNASVVVSGVTFPVPVDYEEELPVKLKL